MLFLAVLRGSFLVPVDDDVDGGGDGGRRGGLVPLTSDSTCRTPKEQEV